MARKSITENDFACLYKIVVGIRDISQKQTDLLGLMQKRMTRLEEKAMILDRGIVVLDRRINRLEDPNPQ